MLPLLPSTQATGGPAGPAAAPAVLDLAAGAGREGARPAAAPGPSASPAAAPVAAAGTPVGDVQALRKAAARARPAPGSPSAGGSRAAGGEEAGAASGRRFARPVTGRITSNFGPRWGTTHYGLDIANRVGTPIRSAGAGTVISAGPASGFGLWVRVRLEDGTVNVYGHINRALVRVGQRVAAGDLIAEVGNRGQSTGPHLHFEAISADGERMDPLAWLQRRGVGDVAG